MAGRSRNLPSKTRLGEILRESAFDPRVDNGVMVPIVDTAIGNPAYAEDRAKELIFSAQRALQAPAGNPDQAANNLKLYHEHMRDAMSLLALARAIRS